MAAKSPNVAGGGMSPVVIVGTLIAVLCLIVGAALYLPPGPASDQRLGVILAVLSPVVLVLTNIIRTELAVTVSRNTKADTGELVDGFLDAKMRAVVHQELVAHDAQHHPSKDPDTHP